jgi:hypothetical protein
MTDDPWVAFLKALTDRVGPALFDVAAIAVYLKDITQEDGTSFLVTAEEIEKHASALDGLADVELDNARMDIEMVRSTRQEIAENQERIARQHKAKKKNAKAQGPDEDDEEASSD